MTPRRNRLPSPAMGVAIVALVIAASGTALAAHTLMSGDQLIRKGSLSGNRLRSHTVTGAQIDLAELGTVPSATTATSATTAVSATNAIHATTADSATNATNAAYATTAGTAAVAQSAPLVTTLPSGVTLRGVWELSGTPNSGSVMGDAQSFSAAPASPPAAHVIPPAPAANPDPTDCPGTAANPAAASEQFCLYEIGANNVATLLVCDPTEGTCGVISRWGFFVASGPTTPSLGDYTSGTWAVTG
jgi:hypothetical protein